MNKSGNAEGAEKGKEESRVGVKEKREEQRDWFEGVIRRGKAEEEAGTKESRHEKERERKEKSEERGRQDVKRFSQKRCWMRELLHSPSHPSQNSICMERERRENVYPNVHHTSI